jgi:hypothetical protein
MTDDAIARSVEICMPPPRHRHTLMRTRVTIDPDAITPTHREQCIAPDAIGIEAARLTIGELIESTEENHERVRVSRPMKCTCVVIVNHLM